jgi:raffinose/stachyose/melibiose transport system substrate-binding protein
MTRSRRMVAVGVASAVAVLVAGCGGSDPGQSAGGDGFSAWALTGGAETAFKTSFDQWNKDHSDQAVSAEYFANDAYKEKIRTAVGSGNAPTLIFNWTGGTLRDYVDNGDVVDLTDSTKPLQSRLVPSVLDSGRIDGKVYAVPNNNAQPIVLFYNKPLFEKAGIDAPPATFDEMLDDVALLKDAGVETPISLAAQSQWPELMWIEYLADRVGGPEAFQAVVDGKPGAWENPDIVKALDLIKQLVDAGAFGTKYGSVVADAGADVALVHTGKAGMLLQGAWVYGSFLTDAPDFVSSGDLGYADFPAVTGGKGDPADIVGNPANFWSVSANASKTQQQAAIDYLNDALFDASYVDTLVETGNVPVTNDAADKIASSDQADFLTFAYDMVTGAPSFQLSWDQALSAAQAQALLTNLSQVFLGDQTPEEFASAMGSAQ